MPSRDHELVVMLLRERPEVVVRLLEAVGVAVPPHRELRIREADFTQLVPTEYRADLVITLETDAPVAAFVIEPQYSRDEGKRFTWPLYLAALHARVRCPTWLVVLAGSEHLARWASREIETFHPGSRFAPLVVSPRDIPRITSIDEAIALPELAVLSARAHGNEPGGTEVAIAAIAACDAMAMRDEVHARLYNDAVFGRLNASARELLEAEMRARGYEYESEFARRYYHQGREEGREEGCTAIREACRTLIEAKLGVVRADLEAVLGSLLQPDALQALLRELASAPDAAAVEAILDRLQS